MILFSAVVGILILFLMSQMSSSQIPRSIYQINSTSSTDIAYEINKVRVLSGLPSLVECHNLDDVATKFLLDQYQRQFFNHIDPEGKTPKDRVQAGGYGKASSIVVSDLLAYDKRTPSLVVSAWVQNASNLATIRNPLATHIGAAGIVGSVQAWRAAGFDNWNRVPFWCAIIASGGGCSLRPLTPPTFAFTGIPSCSGSACTVLGTMDNSIPQAYTSDTL